METRKFIGPMLTALIVGLLAGGIVLAQDQSTRPEAPPDGSRKAEQRKRLAAEAAKLGRKEVDLQLQLDALQNAQSKLNRQKRQARQQVNESIRRARNLPFTGCPNGTPFDQCTHTAQKQKYLKRKKQLISQARLRYKAQKTGFDRSQGELDDRRDGLNLEREKLRQDRADLERRRREAAGP
jgi:hypothetical protein